MAFAVKYRATFKDKFDQQTHRVDILEDGFSGSIINLRQADNIFQINVDDSKWVVGSEAIFAFIVNINNISSYDSDFYNNQYKTLKLQFYVDSVLEWVGWLKPENTTRQFMYPEVVYKISATDGLNDLKKVDYEGYYEAGYESPLQIIKNAISFLGIDDLDFHIQCGIYEDLLMTSDQDSFKEVQMENKRFYKETNGEFKPMKCYDVIENVVKIFYCKFYQSGQYWRIVNGQEYVSVNESDYQSEARIYSYSDLTLSSTTNPFGRVVSLGSSYNRPADNKWELTKQQPLRQLRLTFRNLNLGGNELLNGDFNLTTGWNNAAGSSAWELFALEGTGFLNLTEPPSGDPNTTKFFYSDTFTITSAEQDGFFDYIIDLELIGVSYNSGNATSNPIYLQVTIFYPDNTGIQTSLIIIQPGRIQYTTPFPTQFPVDQEGDYYIRIAYLPNSGADINSVALKVHSVSVINTAALDQILTTDTLYIDRPAVEAYDEDEEEVIFGDSLQLTDVGALLVNGELTSSWSRFFAVSSSPVIEDSLLLYLKLDNNVNDDSGKSYSITNNGVTFVTDRDANVNSAGSFDGISDNILINDDSDLDAGYITICAWIYRDFTTGEKAIISRGSSFSINVDVDDLRIRLRVQGDSTAYTAKCPEGFGSISNNTWTHIAVVWNGSGAKFYKNGDFISSSIIVKSLTPFETVSGPINFGSDAHVGQAAFGGTYWEGALDEIIYYGRALSDTEVRSVYLNGPINFQSSIPDLTEKLPLLYLFSQQYLNDRKDYYDILNFEFFDPNNDFEFNDIINFGSKFYRFGNYSKDYNSKTISGDLVQVDYEDIGFTRRIQFLNSVDGNSTKTVVGGGGTVSFQPIYDALGLKADKNGGDNQMYYYPADTDSTSIFIALLSNGRLLLRPALDKIVELINELIETKVDEDGGDAEMLYYPEDDDNVSGFFSGLLTGGAATIRNALDRIVSYVKSISPDSNFSGFDINIDDVNTYDLNIAVNTSGNNAPTGWYLTAIPNLRPVMYIDGVLVIYGDGVKTEDWYFGTEDSLNNITAVAFADLTGNEQIYWNGTINGNRSQSITFGDLKTWHSVTFLHCGITTDIPSWDSVLPSDSVSASVSASASVSDSIPDSLSDDEYILATSPWAYLKFDETDSSPEIAYDETTNNNDFTLVNAPALQQTPLVNDGGYSIGLDEADDNLIYRDIAHNPGTGLIAIYTVVDIDNGGGDDAVFGCASDSSNNPVVWLTKTGLNLRIFVRTNTGSILINVDTGFEFFSSGVHRVFFVFDGANGEYELYIDDFGSAPVASGTFTAGQNINVNNVSIASIRRQGTIQNTVTGNVDSTIIWMGSAPALTTIEEIDTRLGF